MTVERRLTCTVSPWKIFARLVLICIGGLFLSATLIVAFLLWPLVPADAIILLPLLLPTVLSLALLVSAPRGRLKETGPSSLPHLRRSDPRADVPGLWCLLAAPGYIRGQCPSERSTGRPGP